MKKISNLLASVIITASLVFTPVVAFAQELPPEEVTVAETTTPTTTPTTTAGVPETGIAPEPSKLAQNTLVFAVGGTVGAAIGLGIITLRKKNTRS
ncbi:hypothetical protein KBD20_02465 [Candidatus Saccharibacteria bacterium]|nr:hypothetical protein [Candidatus Saccharibacteria bacterium]